MGSYEPPSLEPLRISPDMTAAAPPAAPQQAQPDPSDALAQLQARACGWILTCSCVWGVRVGGNNIGFCLRTPRSSGAGVHASVLVLARLEVRAPVRVTPCAREWHAGCVGGQSASAHGCVAPARLSRSTTRVISNLKSGFVVGSAFLAWLYYTQRHHSCISTRTHCGTCTNV